MGTINLSLSGPMSDWIDSQTASGKFKSADDYVHDLIRQDQERISAIAELQELAREGLASGMSDRSFDDVIAAAKRRTFDRAEA